MSDDLACWVFGVFDQFVEVNKLIGDFDQFPDIGKLVGF